MKKSSRVFVRRVKKFESSMVRGRRKLSEIKNACHTKTTASSIQIDEINSPMKKETKLDINKKITRSNLSKTKVALQTCNSPTCITSFFCAQGTTLSNTENPSHAHCLFTNEETTCVDVRGNVLSDIEHFKTDETPVAVPIHGPSTPHRINMPNNQLEDLEEATLVNGKDKKSVTSAFSSVQQLNKKPVARARRKLNHNHTANHRSIETVATESTNHKLTDYFPVRRSVRKSKKAVLEEKQRDLENKVLCQVQEGLKEERFHGKGRGVITSRKFVKGEFVVEYSGELIDQVEAKEREKKYAQDQNTGCYMYYFQHRNHQYCVDATEETDKLGRLVNHSRNGNLIARVVEVESQPHLVLTAKEDIPAGVEVTYDYGDRRREAIRHHPWLAL